MLELFLTFAAILAGPLLPIVPLDSDVTGLATGGSTPTTGAATTTDIAIPLVLILSTRLGGDKLCHRMWLTGRGHSYAHRLRGHQIVNGTSHYRKIKSQHYGHQGRIHRVIRAMTTATIVVVGWGDSSFNPKSPGVAEVVGNKTRDGVEVGIKDSKSECKRAGHEIFDIAGAGDLGEDVLEERKNGVAIIVGADVVLLSLVPIWHTSR